MPREQRNRKWGPNRNMKLGTVREKAFVEREAAAESGKLNGEKTELHTRARSKRELGDLGASWRRSP